MVEIQKRGRFLTNYNLRLFWELAIKNTKKTEENNVDFQYSIYE